MCAMLTMSSKTIKPDAGFQFTPEDREEFIAMEHARDKEGRGWDSLFKPASPVPYEISGDHIILPLVSDCGELGLDARRDAVLHAHNHKAEQAYEAAKTRGEEVKPLADYCSFAPHPTDKTMLKRFLGGKKQNKDLKLISFLQSKDDAESHLLAHDLTVEWGKKDVPAQSEATVASHQFDKIKNTKPLAADSFAPDALRVVISRDALDIAAMSAGRRWRSCMSPGEFNYHYVPEEIKAGTLVAYLVHRDDKDLRYPLMRVLLKPFHNHKGETILVPNRVYASSSVPGNSQMQGGLLGTLKDFVAHYVNSEKSGGFTMADGIYSDGQEKTLTLGAALEKDGLANAIADAIPDKIKEYTTEIEAAHQRGDEVAKRMYIKKLSDIYGQDESFALAYLRNLRSANIDQAMPKPSEVKAALKSSTVQLALEELKIFASIYIKGKDWAEYMQKSHPNRTIVRPIGNGALEILMGDQPLTSLSLYERNISALGAETLASYKAITALSLSNNPIGDTGAIALAGHKTLTTLDVSYSSIGDAGAVALADNKTLTTLYISHNNIGDAGAIALAGNKTLTALYIDHNNIGDAGAAALAGNKTLTTLYIGWDIIGDEGLKKLSDGLRQNKNLLDYMGPNGLDLDEHVQSNREEAEKYANSLLGGLPLSAEDKNEIRQRANAIRHVLTRDLPKFSTQRRNALEKLDAVMTSMQSGASWADRASKTPRQLG